MNIRGKLLIKSFLKWSTSPKQLSVKTKKKQHWILFQNLTTKLIYKTFPILQKTNFSLLKLLASTKYNVIFTLLFLCLNTTIARTVVTLIQVNWMLSIIVLTITSLLARQFPSDSQLIHFAGHFRQLTKTKDASFQLIIPSIKKKRTFAKRRVHFQYPLQRILAMWNSLLDRNNPLCTCNDIHRVSLHTQITECTRNTYKQNDTKQNKKVLHCN